MRLIKNKSITLIFLIVFAILASFSLSDIVSAQDNTKVGAQEGLKAPGFKLQNISGNDVSLSNFQDKIVFLNFWASWCPPCKAEMPDIQKLYNNNDNVKILAVNVQESKDKVINFLMENNYSFTTLLDKNGSTAANYLVRGIPTTFVIEDGIITTRHTGVLNYKQMQDLLNNE